MTTEIEIFKKYKPAEDGWISNTKFRQAIHEAYEAGKADGVYLLDKALFANKKGSAEARAKEIIQSQTAQAIFAELDGEFVNGAIAGGLLVNANAWKEIKAKYLKATP